MCEDKESANSNYVSLHLRQFSYFDSIQEMDYIVKTYNKDLKKSVYETLNLIKQYSCKWVGVAHLKTQTIAKRLNKSISTIRRHIKTLKDKGILTVITTMRKKSGGYGANGFAINSPVERKRVLKSKNEHSEMNTRKEVVNRGQTIDNTDSNNVLVSKETIISLKLYNSLKLQKEVGSDIQNKKTENIKNYEECPNGISNEIYFMYKAYFSTHTLEKLSECATEALIPFDIESNEKVNITIQSFKGLIHGLKDANRFKRNKIKSIFKYIKGIVRKKAQQHIDAVDDDSKPDQMGQLQSREMTPKWLQNETSNPKIHKNREMTPEWLKNRYESDHVRKNETEEDPNLKADREAFLKKLKEQ